MPRRCAPRFHPTRPGGWAASDRRDSRDWDEAANQSGIQAVADGEPTRWFEEIWSAGVRDEIDMPWDRRAPNPLIVDRVGALAGRRAVVIGAGLGAAAEFLAGRGYETVAFLLTLPNRRCRPARQRYGRPVDGTTHEAGRMRLLGGGTAPPGLSRAARRLQPNRNRVQSFGKSNQARPRLGVKTRNPPPFSSSQAPGSGA